MPASDRSPGWPPGKANRGANRRRHASLTGLALAMQLWRANLNVLWRLTIDPATTDAWLVATAAKATAGKRRVPEHPASGRYLRRRVLRLPLQQKETQ